MKNQHAMLKRKNQPAKLVAFLAMLLVACCFCGVMVSAAIADNAPVVHIDAASGITLDEATGRWVKTYDGTAAIDNQYVTVTVDGQTVNATSAVFSSADAGEQFITVTYTLNGVESSLRLAARIAPVKLSLVGNGTVSAVYDPAKKVYSDLVVNAEGVSLDETAFVGTDRLVISSVGNVSIESDVVAGSTVNTYTYVTLAAAEGSSALVTNYEVDLLPVVATFDAVVLGNVTWSNDGAYAFAYGDEAALNVSASATTADGVVVPLKVMVVVNGSYYTLAQAYELGLYGNVSAGNVEELYTLEVVVPNEELYVLDSNDTHISNVVKITRVVYNVTLEDQVILGKADMSDPTNIKPMLYQLLVGGADIPAEVLAKITYTYYDANDNVVGADGVSAPGTYKVVAVLPSLEENGFENYAFSATELTATLTIKANYVIVGDKNAPAQIVIVGSNGIPNELTAEFSVPEIDKNIVRKFKVYEAYSLVLAGMGSQKYTLYIPIPADLISASNCEALRASDLYLYNALGTIDNAEKKFSVKLSEDGAYYIVENFTAEGTVSFLIAPEYNTPFWISAPGIILILLLVVLVLLVMFLIGLKLRQIERSEQNAALVIDTEGDVPEYVPVVVEDKIEDVDAALDETVGALAGALVDEVAPEAAEETEADAAEAVEEAMSDLADEAAIEPEDADLAAADEAAENLADSVAEELTETVAPAEETADVSDEVDTAVAEAMEENLDDSADAVDAIAMVDDDDDDEGFLGAVGAGLTYIDVKEEPELYAEMLVREERGESQLVYRYRRSYQSKLVQSQGSVQDYYNIIKNTLLSYKGIKSRVSWNYEAFNCGRTHVAKFNAKTRTLYLYLALDPTELADSKYGFTDMSAKKKYASVPVLMKIKGDRKFKHALELVTVLCEEKLGLQKKKTFEEVDYKLPYMTTEEMVEEGLVKKLAAEISLVEEANEAELEAPAVESPEEVSASAETASESTEA